MGIIALIAAGVTATTVLDRDSDPDPDSAGRHEETMIEFLDAVRVNESAQPGLG